MKTCKYGCGGKMKSGGKVTSIKKKYQDGGPTLADLEKKDRRNILGGLSAKLGIGTAGAGIAAIAGKKIADTVKKNREANKEVKGMVKNIVKKAKSTKVMQKGGSTKMQMGGYAKPQMGGDNTKMGIYGVPNAGRTDALGFKKGGSTTNRAVKPGCRGGMVKDASGNCVMERKMQKGGSSQDKKMSDLAKRGVGPVPKSTVDGNKWVKNTKAPDAKKYQKGGFPDLNKDGKVTKADILKGRGVIKKIGGSIKKK